MTWFSGSGATYVELDPSTLQFDEKALCQDRHCRHAAIQHHVDRKICMVRDCACLHLRPHPEAP